MDERDSRFWIKTKAGWKLRRRVWQHLIRFAEASVSRYAKRLPYWIDLDELKQRIVCKIPRLMELMPPTFHSSSKRMTDEEYYIYCRASFEARQILSRQPRSFDPMEDVSEREKERVDIDIIDHANKLTDCLTPVDKRIILLHYAGRKTKRIAKYLGWSVARVQQTIIDVKIQLGIIKDEPRETRRAA